MYRTLLQGVSKKFVLIGCVLRKRYVFILYFTHPHLFNENELRTHTLHSKVRYFHVTRNVKSKIFCAKTFNIFYVFGREKNATSSIRAPIKPRKFPLKHLENPQKHLEFPTSDVFLPL